LRDRKEHLNYLSLTYLEIKNCFGDDEGMKIYSGLNMTLLQRFVPYCIIFSTIINGLEFCGVKADFGNHAVMFKEQQQSTKTSN
jgi:hypothetical protein